MLFHSPPTLSLLLQNEKFIIFSKYLLRWEFLGRDLVEWGYKAKCRSVWRYLRWQWSGTVYKGADGSLRSAVEYKIILLHVFSQGQQGECFPDERDGLPAVYDRWSEQSILAFLEKSKWIQTLLFILIRLIPVAWPWHHIKSPSLLCLWKKTSYSNIYQRSCSECSCNMFFIFILLNAFLWCLSSVQPPTVLILDALLIIY